MGKKRSSKISRPRLYRGKPVKRRNRAKGSTAGRPRIHPIDEQSRTMVRRTDVEAAAWNRAALQESLDLGLPPGSELTVGPWMRRLANERARELGAFTVEEDSAASVELAIKAGTL